MKPFRIALLLLMGSLPLATMAQTPEEKGLVIPVPP